MPLGRKMEGIYRKTSRTRYCANATGNNRYKPDGFPHPPTAPEGSVSGSRRPGTVPGVRVLLLAAQIALCSLCLGCLRRGQPAKDKKLPDARDLPPPQAQCQQELFPHARSATERISALPSISAKCEFLTNTGSTRTKSCGVRAREQTRRPTRGLRSVTFP